MFEKHRLYYSVEVADEYDDSVYNFVCSYSTFTDAKQKVDELLLQNSEKKYRILKVEKFVEEVQ